MWRLTFSIICETTFFSVGVFISQYFLAKNGTTFSFGQIFPVSAHILFKQENLTNTDDFVLLLKTKLW